MGRMLVALVLVVAGCKAKAAPSPPPPPPPPRTTPAGFVKGQLHAHTSNSGDSKTLPGDVQRFYESRGYDFVVFTDHNFVTDTPDTGILTVPGVELTKNVQACEPPLAPDAQCLMHMNVLFTAPGGGPVDLRDVTSTSRRDVYRAELARARSLGGIAMLNHPNMDRGGDAALLGALATEDGLVLLEIGNQSWDSGTAGDATMPSTEALWDQVLAKGARVFATVTDDAHHYADAAEMTARGEKPYPPDLGWVMVRAEKNAESIRAAMLRGDFYGSNGPAFATVTLGPDVIALATSDGAPVRYDAIGRGGEVVATATGARFDLALASVREKTPYVRVRATRADGAYALLQPVRTMN